MEIEKKLLEPLLERVENLSKTSIVLLKLQLMERLSMVLSVLVSRLLLSISVIVFVILIATTCSLWLGDLLGRQCYGFGIVSVFFGLLATLIYFIHPWLKSKFNHFFVSALFKD